MLGVMALLRPLLLDVVPTIQQTSALALGRLANYNDDLAEAVVRADILPQLVYSLAEQNVSITKIIKLIMLYQNDLLHFVQNPHSIKLFQWYLHINKFNVDALLQRFYKKAAAFVLRAVAKHSPQLAQV